MRTYWAQVEGNSPFSRLNAYRPVLDAPTHHAAHAWKIAQLLYRAGHFAEALTLQKFLVDHCRQVGDRVGTARALENEALSLRILGDLDGAMALHKESERLCRTLKHKDGLRISLSNQATILEECGDPARAMMLWKKVEQLCREIGNKHGLALSLGGQGGNLLRRHDFDGAMRRRKTQERLCRELGDKDLLAASLLGQADILAARGELDRALAFLKEAEQLWRELGAKPKLTAVLSGRAAILYARGELDGALALSDEAERLFHELGVTGSLAALPLRALALTVHGAVDPQPIFAEAKRLYRAVGRQGWAAGQQASTRNGANARRASSRRPVWPCERSLRTRRAGGRIAAVQRRRSDAAENSARSLDCRPPSLAGRTSSTRTAI